MEPNGGRGVCRPAEHRHSLLLKYLASRKDAGAAMGEILSHLAQVQMDKRLVSKTVRRDIDHLRDFRGYQIEFEPAKQKWFLKGALGDHPDSLMIERLSADELTALRLAFSPVTRAGHPFSRQMNSALRKIVRALPTDQRGELEGGSGGLDVKSGPPVDVDPEVIHLLERAVKERMEVTFFYGGLKDKKQGPRAVHPHSVYLRLEMWYLAAYDPAKKGMRNFAINRGGNWSITQREFVRQSDFDLKTFFEGAFAVMTGVGPNQTIRLLLEPMAGRLVSERLWHDSQKTQARPDGKVEMSLELSSLEEIRRWILQWEGQVKVLEPKELKEQVRAAGKKIATRS